MRLTMDVPVEKSVENFFSYLKKRAADPIHEANADLIADFVDKVLVIEMKRLSNEKETLQDTVEIPDEVFEKLLKEKGLTAPAVQTAPTPAPHPAPSATPAPSVAPVARSGNGHQILKKRDLLDSEKDIIRAEFVNLNGQIAEDACKPIHARLHKDVSIAQVTGFVTYLHRRVAEGALDLRDMNAYLNFIQKHRSIWATYNSPKYQALRAKLKP